MNKEIEELLNDLKNTADTSFFAVCSSKEELEKMPRGVCKFLTLNDKKAKLLLSYIEQLEEELKYSIGIVRHNQIVTKLNKEKKQLENNRDKVIEILGNYKHYSTPTEEQNSENEDIVDNAYNILKGDSE